MLCCDGQPKVLSLDVTGKLVVLGFLCKDSIYALLHLHCVIVYTE